MSFQDLLEIYHNHLVASYEKSLGQTLLGNEICALGYWNFMDNEKNGFMSLKGFVDFMKVIYFYIHVWVV